MSRLSLCAAATVLLALGSGGASVGGTHVVQNGPLTTFRPPQWGTPERNSWMPATHRDHINIMRINGTGLRTVPPPTPAFWPSWSPGRRLIAYSSGLVPAKSSLYTVAPDGTSWHLLAHAAAAPAWSPDGTTIAYEGRCGVRLVTPEGEDVTPTGSACGIPLAVLPVST